VGSVTLCQITLDTYCYFNVFKCKGLLVTFMSRAKTAESNEMPLEVVTRIGTMYKMGMQIPRVRGT